MPPLACLRNAPAAFRARLMADTGPGRPLRGGVVPFDSVQDVFAWRSVSMLELEVSDQVIRETVRVVIGKVLLAPRATQREVRHG